MIIDRYIFKELLKTQVTVFLVLMSIFLAQGLIRLVSEASTGDIPVSLIFTFLIYTLPEYIVFLLPLTVYVSVIISLGRICSDSEMVVLRAVGFSASRIMVITMIIAFSTAVLTAYVSLYVVPYAAAATQELKKQATQNPDFLPIDSGRFVSFDNRYNIYVENVENTGDRKISNIYVIGNEADGTVSVTAAKKGRMEVDEEGIRWLVLENGRRYEHPLEGSFKEGSFGLFRTPISGNITDNSTGRVKLEMMNGEELLSCGELRCSVEFQWRISSALAVIVMSMIAVPLSMVNPRQGRFNRLMPAILIFVAYYMFLLSIRNLISTQKFPLNPGMYIVPVCFLIFAAIPLNMPKTYLKHHLLKRKSVKAAGKTESGD